MGKKFQIGKWGMRLALLAGCSVFLLPTSSDAGQSFFPRASTTLLRSPFLFQVASGGERVYVEEGEVQAYLKRASDYESNQRWREAIEQYLQALKSFPEAVYKTDPKTTPNLFLGVKQYLYRQLAKYPEELAVYRQMFDATSEALFRKALAENDEGILRRIINEMFFASYGDDAADALADMLIEKGRVGEAFLYWNMIMDVYPDADLPRELILFKIASATRYLGDKTRYESTVKRLAAKEYENKTIYLDGQFYRIPEVIKVLEKQPASSYQAAAGELRWPEWGGNAAHNLISDFKAKNDIRIVKTENFAPNGNGPPPNQNKSAGYPFYYPIIVNNRVYVNTGTSVNAYSLNEGKRVGGYPAGADLGPAVPYSYPNQQSGQPMSYNWIFSSVFSEGRLYANLIDTKKPVSSSRSGAQYQAYLACADPITWKAPGNWDTRPLAETDDLLKEIIYFSPPVVYNGRIYAAGLKDTGIEPQVYLFCFASSNGRCELVWKRFICCKMQGGADGWSPYYYAPTNIPTIAESNGIIFCLTNLGIVSAVSADSGDIMWMMNYGDDTVNNQSMSARIASYPVVQDNVVYVTPADTNRIYGFDIYSGTLVKCLGNIGSTPICDLGDGVQILGITERLMILINNNNQIWLFNLKRGSLENDKPMEVTGGIPLAGRGLVTKERIYLPTTKQLLVFDVAKRKLVAAKEWLDDDDAGNLIVAGPYLALVSQKRLNIYQDNDIFTQEFTQKIQAQADNPKLIKEYGQQMRDNHQYVKAIERFQDILEMIETVKPELKGREVEKETRFQLGQLYFLQGNDESKNIKDTEAVTSYRKALVFVSDKSLRAQVLLNLGDSLTHLNNNVEAVAAYQQAITECSAEYYECEIGADQPNQTKKMWVRVPVYAAARINRVLNKFPQARSGVQQSADQALGNLSQRDREDLIRFLTLYPNARQTRDIFLKLADQAVQEGDSYYIVYYLRQAVQQSATAGEAAEPANRLIEYYQKIKSLYKLQHFLTALAAKFPELTVNIGGQKKKVSEYVVKNMNELEEQIWHNIPIGYDETHPLTGSSAPQRFSGQITPAEEACGIPAVPPSPILPDYSCFDAEQTGLLVGPAPADNGVPKTGLFFIQRNGIIEAWNLDKKELRWVNYDIFHRLGATFTENPDDGQLSDKSESTGAELKANVQIAQLNINSPLKQAGLKEKDIVKSVDGNPVKTAAEMINAIDAAFFHKKAEISLVVATSTVSGTVEAKIIITTKELWPLMLNQSSVSYHYTPSGDLIINSPNTLQKIDGANGEVKWVRSPEANPNIFNAGIAYVLTAEERLYVIIAENKPDPRGPDKFLPYVNRLVCFSLGDGQTLWEIEGKENDTEPMTTGGDETVLVRCFPNQMEIIDSDTGETVFQDNLLMPGSENRSRAQTLDKVYYLRDVSTLASYDIYKRASANVMALTGGQSWTRHWLSVSGDFICLASQNNYQVFTTRGGMPVAPNQKITGVLPQNPAPNQPPQQMVQPPQQMVMIKSLTPGDSVYLWTTRGNPSDRGTAHDFKLISFSPAEETDKQVKWLTPPEENYALELIFITETSLVITNELKDQKSVKITFLNRKSGRLRWEIIATPINLPASQKAVTIFNGRLVVTTTEGVEIY